MKEQFKNDILSQSLDNLFESESLLYEILDEVDKDINNNEVPYATLEAREQIVMELEVTYVRIS